MTFKDWLVLQESSPLTRARTAAATEPPTGPARADYMSKSTPTPHELKRNQEEFDKSHRKKKKRKKC